MSGRGTIRKTGVLACHGTQASRLRSVESIGACDGQDDRLP